MQNLGVSQESFDINSELAIVLPERGTQGRPEVLRPTHRAPDHAVVDGDESGTFSRQQFPCRYPSHSIFMIQKPPQRVGGPTLTDQLLCVVVPQRHRDRDVSKESSSP